MNESRTVVREIVWRDVCPWLILLRSFRAATRLRVLLLAAVAVLGTTAGWRICGEVFSGSDDPYLQSVEGEPGPLPELYGQWPWDWAQPWAVFWRTNVESGQTSPPQLCLKNEPVPLAQVRNFVEAFSLRAVGPDGTIQAVGASRLAYMLLVLLWALLVWGFFGGAITRMVAVELAAEEQIPWSKAIGHAREKLFSYFSAPLFPLIGVLLVTVPLLLVGLLMQFDIGLVAVGIVWPLMFLGGLIMTILVLGLLVGWPLMWATISTEGSDAFDAISRCYAYVFQRPIRYLVYIISASVLGMLGYVVVCVFAALVINLTAWSASWGSGGERMIEVLDHVPVPGAAESEGEWGGAAQFGTALIGWWNNAIWLLATAFIYSYFWSASSAIYLLMRHDVDATEMDEVYLDSKEEVFGLPPLEEDENGVPGVVDESPAEEPEKDEPPPEEAAD